MKEGVPEKHRIGGKFFLVPAVLLLLYSIAVIRLPLLNYLGYEFAAAVAFLLPFVPGFYFLRYFRRRMSGAGTAVLPAGREKAEKGEVPLPARGEGGGPPRPIEIVLSALGGSLPLLLIPLAVGWLNGFIVKNCSPGEGLSYYLLIPGVTMIWVIGLACFCTGFFRRPLFWYIAIVVLTLIYPLYLGYATPRIDSYDFIYGYFPGFTYDEDLQITSTLILFRLVTLLAAVFFITAGSFALSRRSAAGDETGAGGSSTHGRAPTGLRLLGLCARKGGWGVIVPAFLLMVAWFFRVGLGFETTQGRIESALGSIVETEHFRICYDAAAVDSGEIRWIAAEHEFRFSQVAATLEVDSEIVITSYLYPDIATKRTLMGAGSTDIAKPWRKEIHLDGGSWRFTLKHELVHILAGEFGMKIIRANTNIALVEGLATALSPVFGMHTLDEYAAAMVHFGIVEDPGELVTTAGFALRSSMVSYVMMGSFCGHLIERYGITPFKKWYSGNSPVSAYGRSVDELVGEWTASLRTVKVDDSWKPHMEYYFLQPSIFAKECARYIANLNREGSLSYGVKDYSGAEKYFRRALGEVWNTSSFTGYMRALLSSGKYSQIIRAFETEMRDAARRKSLVAANFILGDALMMRGDFLKARLVFNDLLRIHLSPGADEAAALRLTVLDDPKTRGVLIPYLAGRMSDSVTLAMLEGMRADSSGPLVPYVVARIRIERGEFTSVLREMAYFGTPFIRAELNSSASSLLAGAFFRVGEFPVSNEYYLQVLRFQRGRAGAARIADRVERGTWFSREWEGMKFRRL